MSTVRIEGDHAPEAIRWLNAVAALVIQEHIRASLASAAAIGNRRKDLSRQEEVTWPAASSYIACLAPYLREMMECRYRDGMTYRDIAAFMGIPIGTVRSRLARGRLQVALIEKNMVRPPRSNPRRHLEAECSETHPDPLTQFGNAQRDLPDAKNKRTVT